MRVYHFSGGFSQKMENRPMTRKKEIYTEVVKSNIEYEDYALWAEDSDGYMTVEELDEMRSSR